MSEKKFSKKHEWISIEGDIATVGITKHATELLGDIVFVEVPEVWKNSGEEMVKLQLLNPPKRQAMFIHLFLGR